MEGLTNQNPAKEAWQEAKMTGVVVVNSGAKQLYMIQARAFFSELGTFPTITCSISERGTRASTGLHSTLNSDQPVRGRSFRTTLNPKP